MEDWSTMPMKPLHTIGYEGSCISDFLTTLKVVGIDLLIDIRDVPISRKKGFSKNGLSQSLQERGIGYLHLKGLGDPKPGRIAAREGRFDDFQRIFRTHMRSSAAKIDLARGVEAAQSHYACLLCFEREHHQCHRCIVAEQMALQGGFNLIHLGVRDFSKCSSKIESARNQHATAFHVG
jgi:uncharacterized protein (DUF488 family)